MSLVKGDIVLAPFPFTDLQQTKLRPAVVIWADSSNQDVTLCFISSQNLSKLGVGEFVIDSSDSEFAGTGLKVNSKVRVTRIVTLERRLITRRLGKLGTNQIQQLNAVMIQAFQLS
ncbi:type II toxin-antitoxin system PemK/MazF family toxin [Chroococcidiopsis sp. CCNUC1]|uniref:type II toxin-antitoxin system PemK/MazF family toxin n=1 Tax=Chroococcidiopsis sp. CCNUC1 TaxID=2653189 RepID=UPI000D07DA2B|nr:type II toxin-antitoxin system PemK/MazF family toxin [Chroococcidiopsis sp. CCNUC1]PSB43477.1 PemK family protein [Cyanosarcina cf. burmensis CCALA 770]URD49089.1 type II toxin-antitoxin system PemK/MazF family toxin [Chroococcidiopsis sp. CCNUC1]